nr:hypothetical protein [Clostridia bacterium]
MLRKVLKYDLGAIWKIWLILSATSVALGAVGGVCMRLVENPELNFAFFPIVILGLILSFIGIIAYIVITSILIIVRYYNNFFTDEAYLTFTLPVKRSTLFDAKILTAFIFNTASALVFTVSLCLMLLIWPGADGSPMLFYFVQDIKDTLDIFSHMVDNKIVVWAIVYSVAFVILMLASFIYSTMATFACITFGGTVAKKHKILMSIAVYYGLSMALEVVSLITSSLFSVVVQALQEYPEIIPNAAIPWVILMLLLGIAAAIVLVSCFFYKFCVSKLRGNLNLA